MKQVHVRDSRMKYYRYIAIFIRPYNVKEECKSVLDK